MYDNDTTTRQPSLRSPGPPADTANPVARRVAILQRSGPRLVERAAEVGVDITYLGITDLFSEPHAYPGPTTDWVIAPATDLTDAIVPRAERQALARLVRAGIEFPLVYIAHEIPKGQIDFPPHGHDDRAQPMNVSKEAAARAIGPVPPPAATTDLASRLGRNAHQILSTIGKALPVAGAIATAPFVLAGAALGALATGLDPVVFGVVPAGPPTYGQPAAWYVLARWEWSAQHHA